MEKKMSITAKFGTKQKEVTFPVPAEFMDWMRTISHDENDEKHFSVKGNNGMKIAFRIFSYGEDF